MEDIYAPLPEPVQKPKTLDGIAGWLWVPLIMLLVVPVMIILKLLSQAKAHPHGSAFHLMAGHPVFLGLVVAVLVVMLAQVIFGWFCLVQLLRKKTSAPGLIKLWLVLAVAATVLVAIQFAFDPVLFADAIDADLTPGAERLAVALNVFWFGLWYLYFGLSKRVKLTFVR